MTDPVRPPRAGAASRDRMIEAAIDLMRGSGLGGAGINEIVRASGAPKGSVYHFFPAGKLQIAAQALDSYAAGVHAFIDAALSSRNDPAAKVRALFDAFARRVEEGGFRRSCAVGTVCLDLDDETDPLRAVLAAALDDWAMLIAFHLDLGDARRTRAMAQAVLAAIEGSYILCRVHRSSQPFRDAGTWLAAAIDAPRTR